MYWGVLFYGFSLVMVPIERDLKVSRLIVAGALSLGLLMTALVTPVVGRWIDRGRGVTVMRVGVCFAVAGLVSASCATNAAALVASWILVGGAMGAVLYEPAFGLIIRAVSDPEERLRALASVSIWGGLASTIFLPLMSVVLAALGWRWTEIAFAAVVLLAAWIMERYAFPKLIPSPGGASTTSQNGDPIPKGIVGLTTIFAAGTLAGVAVTTMLNPLLIERGHPAPLAAITLAFLGIMQLPGRMWLLGKSRSMTTATLGSFLLQSSGLALVAAGGRHLPLSMAGIALFGVGAGLSTLTRPWLVQSMFGVANAGRLNGKIARVQGLARAAGPVSAALLYGAGGGVAVFAFLALLMAAMIPLAAITLRPSYVPA